MFDWEGEAKVNLGFDRDWLTDRRKWIVRRLMPLECERLMLYPDGHTAIFGKDTPDSAMYRQCGNGWAVNESRTVFSRQHIVDAMVTGEVKAFRFGTISSGVGCHELSVADFGDKAVFSSEIDPAACKVWDIRFPDTPNLGDMTRVTFDAEKGCICNPKFDGYKEPDADVLGFSPVDKEYREIPFGYGELDVLSGGTPCFVAGTRIATVDGMVNIEDVKVGDFVLTFKGRFRRVMKVGSKMADGIVDVEFDGGYKVRCTDYHPFPLSDTARGETEKVQIKDGIGKYAHFLSGLSGQVLSVTYVGEGEKVYNIEVDEDHTYCANEVFCFNCTDYSVAGKRAGGAEGSNTRSALSYQMARVGKETGARWVVYENVPGIFSSHGGKDFLWFCHRLCNAGYTLAWRTLDAQYVMTDQHPRATPQRRRRVWLVGWRGTDWRIPAKVVLELAKEVGAEPPMRLVGKGFKELNPNFDPGVSTAKKTGKRRKKAVDEMSLFGGNLFGGGMDSGESESRKVARIIDDKEFPDAADIAEVSDVSLYQFGQKVGKVGYVGKLFAVGSEPSPDTLAPDACANIGNAGIMSNGRVMTLNCGEWLGGIQLSPDGYRRYVALTAEGRTAEANGLLPEAYDGTVCGLSDILVPQALPDYWLSWKACWGIVRRAFERGKMLPKPLLISVVKRIIEEAPQVKWAAEHTADTDKGRADRQNAIECWKSVCRDIGGLSYEKVTAQPPKRESDDGDGDGEQDGAGDDDDGDGRGGRFALSGDETCGSLCAQDFKGANGQDATTGKILPMTKEVMSCESAQLHNVLRPLVEKASTLSCLHETQIVIKERGQEEVHVFENHSQDSRIKEMDGVSPVIPGQAGTGGNNLPILTYVKTSHARKSNGEGERWEELDVAGTRNAIEGADGRNQEIILSTNSNGEDVMPTISACEYKMAQKQKDTSGGYVVERW